MANYIKIKNFDIANGSGIGVSIFFAGCDMEPKCHGCFNSEAWSFDAGELFTNDTLNEVLKLVSNSHISHLSILGGEPLAEANIPAVSKLCNKVKTYYSDKKIWLWTHYKWESLIENEFIRVFILPYIDILVDGEFIEKEKDLTLPWCGSRNQRVVDVKESLKQSKVVLYETN